MTDEVLEWLDSADDDWRVVERERSVSNADRPSYRAIVFHSQQCVDKLMKGAMVGRGVSPPFIHDLPELSRLLAEVVPGWSWELRELQALTHGAVKFRYPLSMPTGKDVQRAADVMNRMRSALLPLLEPQPRDAGRPVDSSSD